MIMEGQLISLMRSGLIIFTHCAKVGGIQVNGTNAASRKLTITVLSTWLKCKTCFPNGFTPGKACFGLC